MVMNTEDGMQRQAERRLMSWSFACREGADVDSIKSKREIQKTKIYTTAGTKKF